MFVSLSVLQTVQSLKEHSLTKKISKSNLLYESKLGYEAAEAIRRICSAFLGSSESERTAKKWFSQFSFGDEKLEDKPCADHPSILHKIQLEEEIKQNPHQTCQKLAHRFKVSGENIQSHWITLAWKLKYGFLVICLKKISSNCWTFAFYCCRTTTKPLSGIKYWHVT